MDLNSVISAGIGIKINFMSDYTQQVVFSSDEPSLIMTFDTAMGLHSVWLLRQAKTEVSIWLHMFWGLVNF